MQSVVNCFGKKMLHKFQKKRNKRYHEETWLQIVMDIFGMTNHKQFPASQLFIRSFCSASGFLVHASFIYSAAAFILHNGPFSTKRTIPDAISVVLTVIIWHQIHLQFNKFHVFYSYLTNVPKNRLQFTGKEKRIINAIVFIAFSLPVIFSAPMVLSSYKSRSEDYIRFWLLGHSFINQKELESLLLFICMLLYFSSKLLIPSLSAILYATFSYKLSKSIRLQSEIMKSNVRSHPFSVEIEMYYRILDCCKLFNNYSKVTVLLLICHFCNILYTGLSLALRTKTSAPENAMAIESVLAIVTSTSVVAGLFSFASGIPTAMAEIRTEFRQLYHQIILDDRSIALKNFVMLKALGDTEPFYLTAWDLFRIDKSLILTIFGTTLSFCILILQLKRVDLDSMK
ncbi:hypothetical protein AVEN_162839-1 [Araneus ventricosus]|uniref:Gustatory receptor n=1 Tax=Araneus ventricosus TaxID=182803 RepID=A0A4Y2C7M5_ARAVE|nr:hypothetical protein AVEN_162839-1 [Araneus ventricosus]